MKSVKNSNYEMGINFIIPFYNDYKFLDYSVDSILKSINKFNSSYGTKLAYELVIVNDCSPNPEEAEKTFDRQRRKTEYLTVITHDTNKGVSASRNTGVRESSKKYKYLFFLAADDMITNEYIQISWPYLNQDYDLIYADDLVYLNHEQKTPVNIVIRSDFTDSEFLSDIYNKALFSDCFIVKRDAYEEIGGFDEIRDLPNGERFYLNEDVDFMLTIYGYYQEGLKYMKIKKPMYIRVHAKSSDERLVTKCFSYPSTLYNKIYRYKKHGPVWKKIIEKRGFKLIKPPLYDKYEHLFTPTVPKGYYDSN